MHHFNSVVLNVSLWVYQLESTISNLLLLIHYLGPNFQTPLSQRHHHAIAILNPAFRNGHFKPTSFDPSCWIHLLVHTILRQSGITALQSPRFKYFYLSTPTLSDLNLPSWIHHFESTDSNRSSPLPHFHFVIFKPASWIHHLVPAICWDNYLKLDPPSRIRFLMSFYLNMSFWISHFQSTDQFNLEFLFQNHLEFTIRNLNYGILTSYIRHLEFALLN